MTAFDVALETMALIRSLADGSKSVSKRKVYDEILMILEAQYIAAFSGGEPQ